LDQGEEQEAAGDGAGDGFAFVKNFRYGCIAD
jgi:hypothetical protein